MHDIQILQMPLFQRAYKKLHLKEKSIVDDAIRAIAKNPTIGEQKKGDLINIYVYKFKIHQQEMLMAYEWDPEQRVLLALGVHENFCHDLKR
jgi:mRNA-degrading endonuclease RelE of RelBE toxin-antitoxin system